MIHSDLLGATPLVDGSCRFVVWSPLSERVEVRIVAPEERRLCLESDGCGYHRGVVPDVGPGARYRFQLDDRGEFPDPASRSQPEGVHGPSEVVAIADGPGGDGTTSVWRGVPLEDYVVYELHVGTFSGPGTFEGVIPHLGELARLGITAIELMPVSEFPGSRNWGYDGVFPFAAQSSYGGIQGLRRLVDACHAHGLAIVLDVVYNHLGPEGNRFHEYGSYFTDRYGTPWGFAINFDGPHSDEVRRYFIENALWWIRDVGFDALRLDALHAIFDQSAKPFLEELGGAVGVAAAELGRSVHLIAESDLNAPRLILAREEGGYELDAQWSDDFHHAIHVLLTGERDGYYEDFGGVEQMAKVFRNGYVYTGEYSRHRRRRHGRPTRGCAARQFVVCSQNHDQVGNRMLGERLSALVPPEKLRLAATSVILSPFVPLLFMGEEYAETAPFQYFVSHGDAGLIEAVRKGRREEFQAFAWKDEAPDPQAEATFLRSKLRHGQKTERAGAALLAWYTELLKTRRSVPALKAPDLEAVEAVALSEEKVVCVRRKTHESEAFLVLSFAEAEISATIPLPAGTWERRLDSEEPRWGGRGSSVPSTVEAGPTGASLKLLGSSAVLFTRPSSQNPRGS